MQEEVMEQATEIGMELITLALLAMKEGKEEDSVFQLLATADAMQSEVARELAIFYCNLYAATLVDYIGDIDGALKAHRDGCVALLSDDG